MASPSAGFEPLLASSIRVLRNITSVQDLISAFPSLKQKSLASPPSLTDSERRLFLDLPDEDMETSNISAVTSLTRVQLIEKAVSDRASLTQEEVMLLKDRFWTTITVEEHGKVWRCLGTGDFDKLYAIRLPAYLPNEEEAIRIGSAESWGRAKAIKDEKLRVTARAALPYAQEWIQHLYQQDRMCWGFIWLYDATIQQLDPARLEHFNIFLEAFFRQALSYNGSRDIINQKWKKIPFNLPNTAFAPTSAAVSYQDGTIFRKAFQEILRDPQEYQKAEDVTPVNTCTHQYKDGISASGVLTNTFLVIDPVCIDSVIPADGLQYTIRWDNMRILAFEADFPVEGRTYAEGYQGFTWVRMDQLIYNFYELRLMKANEIGMDEIWKAAQKSRHGAFVSMDPEEALNWKPTCSMSGFRRDTVIGKRWYAMRDARKEAEG